MNTKLHLVTFNLRYSWDGDGVNSFMHRAGQVFHKLDVEKPDIVCFQEVMSETAPFLRAHLPDYEIQFMGRDPDLAGEGLCTAVRRDSAELLENRYFWLSPTPYEPGSRYEGQSKNPRICQAMMLRKKGCERFRIYHIHLDELSDQVRIMEIRQTLEQMVEGQRQRPMPCFLLGDFNAEPSSGPIQLCDSFDGITLQDLTRDTGGTFHDFGRLENPEKIDYIYADVETARREHSVSLWTDCHAGIYLSDHYPVSITISMP